MLRRVAVVAAAVAVAASAAGVAALPFNASDYDHVAVFASGDYELHWTIENNQDIKLAMRAATTGWVGFGLGEPSSGAMPGADIVMGFVDGTGVGTLEDRFGLAESLPSLDASCAQDWTLLNADESGGWTTIEGRRALDTQDTQDRVIGSGAVKILWAYGSSDSLIYHGQTTRGLNGVNFLDFNAPDPIDAVNATPGVLSFDFPANQVIPGVVTTYADTFVEIPPINTNIDGDGRGAAHVIGIKEFIDNETAPFVHHFVLKCIYNTTLTGGTQSKDLYAWAPGTEALVLPSNAGIRVGQQVGSCFVLQLETHYDNPQGAGTGMLDQSGLTLFYTTTLRPNDASTLLLGDVYVQQPDSVPQGSGQAIFHYDCPAACTTRLPAGGVTAFASFLHMHEAGARSVITHWRGGQRLADLGRVEFWTKDLQQLVPISATILPGDELRVTCVYNRDTARDVPFGQPSDQEMCLPFLYIAEPMPFSACGFYYDTANHTICDQPIGVPNPTAVDDPSVIDITFGVPSCSAPSTSATTGAASGASSTAAAADSSTLSAAPAALAASGTLALLAAATALW